jgi:hypothetical protein
MIILKKLIVPMGLLIGPVCNPSDGADYQSGDVQRTIRVLRGKREDARR